MFYARGNHAREKAFKVGHTVNKQFSSNDSKELLKILQEANAEDINKVRSFK